MNELERVVRDRVSREIGPSMPRSSRRVAMVYPSPYAVAMSSLGYQRITMILREAGIAAERCILPDDPAEWRRSRTVLRTLETGTPLSSFPLVAVSFAYEAELIGLIELLDLAGIPPLRAERTDDHPV